MVNFEAAVCEYATAAAYISRNGDRSPIWAARSCLDGFVSGYTDMSCSGKVIPHWNYLD